MSDFLAFNHDAGADGQVALGSFGGNTYEQCEAVAQDKTLDSWVTTCGAEDVLRQFKVDFALHGDDIRAMSGLLSKNLNDTSELIYSTELQNMKLWAM
jgi:hypothetical protein